MSLLEARLDEPQVCSNMLHGKCINKGPDGQTNCHCKNGRPGWGFNKHNQEPPSSALQQFPAWHDPEMD